MNASARRIMVASDIVDDANVVRGLLKKEFEHVAISTDEDAAVADFERHRPEVLVLAFDKLEKAERYYLGLYRLSASIHSIRHRTVILCGKDEVQRVYELCRKAHFDDYVLFWPASYDAPRLLMAIHQACAHLRTDNEPSVAEFAAGARALNGLDAEIDQVLKKGKITEVPPKLSKQLESVSALTTMANRVRPYVLVVDDDEFQRKVLGRMLEPLQLDVEFAASAQETLSILRAQRRPDLILMDIQLPDINGVQLTRRIKAADGLAGIPVVMVTGHSDRQIIIDCRAAGAEDFIVKPFDRPTLRQKVDRALKRPAGAVAA